MPHIDNNVKLDFKDVLIRPKRSTIRSRADVDLSWKVAHRHSKKNFPDDVIPIIVSNMDTTGTFTMAKEIAQHKMLTAIHKHYTVDEWNKFAAENADVLPYVIASCGMVDKDVDKISVILSSIPEIRAICLDVANGYSEHFVDFVKKIRTKFPEHIVIAGNVVTGEMVEQLILNGADIVKVGIGPGSVCTTRRQTGVGYPQVSAVLESADAAHGLKGQVISDGGCTCPGDIAKAFGAGADFVMLGGMFAGHDQSGMTS